MACPFFMPDQRVEADWPFPQRLPLGAAWSGVCGAASHDTRPTNQELKSCNLGYARGCDRLPLERPADAVRFSLGEEREGLVRIRFAFEREYLPAGSGELVYEVASDRVQTEHANGCLLRMAECYVQSQLLRRGGAGRFSQEETTVG